MSSRPTNRTPPPRPSSWAQRGATCSSARSWPADSGELTIVDARAAERYRGEFEPIDLVAGHIPGAVNMPLTTNLDATGRFKSAKELRLDYGHVLSEDKPAVAVMRQRHDRLPQHHRHARRRASRSAALRGLVQRLEPLRNAGRHRF